MTKFFASIKTESDCSESHSHRRHKCDGPRRAAVATPSLQLLMAAAVVKIAVLQNIFFDNEPRNAIPVLVHARLLEQAEWPRIQVAEEALLFLQEEWHNAGGGRPGSTSGGKKSFSFSDNVLLTSAGTSGRRAAGFTSEDGAWTKNATAISASRGPESSLFAGTISGFPVLRSWVTSEKDPASSEDERATGRDSTTDDLADDPVTSSRRPALADENGKEDQLVLHWEKKILSKAKARSIFDRPVIAIAPALFASSRSGSVSGVVKLFQHNAAQAASTSGVLFPPTLYADGKYSMEIPKDAKFPTFFAPCEVRRGDQHPAEEMRSSSVNDHGAQDETSDGKRMLEQKPGFDKKPSLQLADLLPDFFSKITTKTNGDNKNIVEPNSTTEEPQNKKLRPIGRGRMSVVHEAVFEGMRVAVKRFAFEQSPKGAPSQHNMYLYRTVLQAAKQECSWARKIFETKHPAARFFVRCLATNLPGLRPLERRGGLPLHTAGHGEEDERTSTRISMAQHQSAFVAPAGQKAAADASKEELSSLDTTMTSTAGKQLFVIMSYGGKSEFPSSPLIPPSSSEVDLNVESQQDLTAPRILAQLTEAINFLQTKLQVAHHDLRRENVLFDEESQEIRILGFGGMRSFDDKEMEQDTSTSEGKEQEENLNLYENPVMMPKEAYNDVLWTPTFASQEFETGNATCALFDEKMEEEKKLEHKLILRTYDFFSLGVLFSEMFLLNKASTAMNSRAASSSASALLTTPKSGTSNAQRPATTRSTNLIAEKYTVFCSSSVLRPENQLNCLAKAVPYFIDWDKLKHDMQTSTLLTVQLFEAAKVQQMKTEAKTTFSPTVVQKNTPPPAPSSWNGAAQLTQDSEFVSIFCDIWRGLFLEPEKRFEAFQNLVALFKPLWSNRSAKTPERSRSKSSPPSTSRSTSTGSSGRTSSYLESNSTEGILSASQGSTSPLLSRAGATREIMGIVTSSPELLSSKNNSTSTETTAGREETQEEVFSL
ncbi:unnamed protein product [Amoebophrya sp. A120]|nr:unnamed protein product [Amoebophrya sp. A120]|eukprot:GSA120T00008278001.1